jgi:MFS family permease
VSRVPGKSGSPLRNLLVLASALVFVDTLFFAALTPLLPTYVDELGLSKAEAGILSSAYAVGALVAALPAGFLASRLGPRRVVYAGLLLLGVSSIAVGSASQIALLDLARFVQGVAGSMIWSGALTWIIAGAPLDRRGAAIGTAIGTGVAGALLGPVVGALAGAVGTQTVFSATALVTLALAYAASRVDDRHVADVQSVAEIVRGILTQGVLNAGLFTAIPALCFGVLAVLTPLKMDALGGGAGLIAGAFLGTALIEAVMAPISGRWSDRVGRRLPYVAGLVVCGVALALIADASSITVLVGALLVSSVGAGACVTPAFAMMSDAAALANIHQGFAVAVNNTAWSLGQALGSIGGGALATLGGNKLSLFGVIGVLFITSLYAAWHLPSPDRPAA